MPAKKLELTKERAERIWSQAAVLLKQMGKNEIGFKEFEKAYQTKKGFLKNFWKALKRYALDPRHPRFVDPSGEVIIYVNWREKKFEIKRIGGHE